MKFEQILTALRVGKAVTRPGYTMYLRLLLGKIKMLRTAENAPQDWIPDQLDILAEDWQIL